MLRDKKAEGGADHTLELVLFIILMSVLVYAVFLGTMEKKKAVTEKVVELSQKSEANYLLMEYLDSSIDSCLVYDGSATIELRKKGNLTFADLITLIVKGSPDTPQIFDEEDASSHFRNTDEPYGDYAKIWKSCTDYYFSDKYNGNLGFSIYYNGNRDYITTNYGKQALLIGQAMIPYWDWYMDAINVRVYKLK